MTILGQWSRQKKQEKQKRGTSKRYKTVYQNHHPDRIRYPDWTIKVRKNHHLFIWRQVQGLKVNRDSQRDLWALLDSILYEICRREELLEKYEKV